MWFWGLAMMALFVVLIVWLVRANVASYSQPDTAPGDTAGRAREILDERVGAEYSVVGSELRFRELCSHAQRVAAVLI